MKRFAVLCAGLLVSLVVAYAQSQQPMEMTGWICSSTCVKQSAGQATCDANCADKSGDPVFVQDNGKVTKISNPDKVKGHMGEKVKAKCKMSKDKQAMEIEELILSNAG
jgi:hypothetical protein